MIPDYMMYSVVVTIRDICREYYQEPYDPWISKDNRELCKINLFKEEVDNEFLTEHEDQMEEIYAALQDDEFLKDLTMELEPLEGAIYVIKEEE